MKNHFNPNYDPNPNQVDFVPEANKTLTRCHIIDHIQLIMANTE